jgi:hypothetical protein
MLPRLRGQDCILSPPSACTTGSYPSRPFFTIASLRGSIGMAKYYTRDPVPLSAACPEADGPRCTAFACRLLPTLDTAHPDTLDPQCRCCMSIVVRICFDPNAYPPVAALGFGSSASHVSLGYISSHHKTPSVWTKVQSQPSACFHFLRSLCVPSSLPAWAIFCS